MAEKTPVLTIGMIVKNEIRCIERCLKALQPLRDAVPCELIIADTGSTDGTREVAAQYADLVFDFAWINDFSAARNSVLKRARGQWYFSVDADEYLDEDIRELVSFLRNPKQWMTEMSVVTVRNYATTDEDSLYTDSQVIRLVKINPELRYEGRIHEVFVGYKKNTAHPSIVMLHHDGYIDFCGSGGEKKRRRNLELLDRELEEDPQKIYRILQCIESSIGEESHILYIRRALEILDDSSSLAPIIYRYAIGAFSELDLPGQDELIEKAVALHPDSVYVRVDIAAYAHFRAKAKGLWLNAIQWGERYLAGLEYYQKHKTRLKELLYSYLRLENVSARRNVLTSMAEACVEAGQFDHARNYIQDALAMKLTWDETMRGFRNLVRIHRRSDLNVESTFLDLWEYINHGFAPEEAQERRESMLRYAAKTFTKAFREQEMQKEGDCRPTCTIFRPLRGIHEVGNAAYILAAKTKDEMEQGLTAVVSWNEFPPEALVYALRHGACFPPKNTAFCVEKLDGLAMKLDAMDENVLMELLTPQLQKPEIPDHPDQLNWLRAMVFTSLRSRRWNEETAGENIRLVRLFAEVEKVFLPLCYRAADEYGLRFMSPIHRTGWYLIRAFESLDCGDKTGYIHLLKEALLTHESMKPMIEFLLEEFDKQQRREAVAEAPEELWSLAEQIKNLLAQYPEDHPAVLELKQSELYKEVSFLIKDSSKGVLS